MPETQNALTPSVISEKQGPYVVKNLEDGSTEVTAGDRLFIAKNPQGTDVELYDADIAKAINESIGLADKQPRRVRHENGVTEKLVKYADGHFEWQTVEQQALTAAVEAIDEIEDTNEHQKEEINALRTEISDLKAEVMALKDLLTKKAEQEAGTDGTVEQSPENNDETETEADSEAEAAEQAEAPQPVPIEQFVIDYAKNTELMDEWTEARQNYASLTAQHRDDYFGHLLHNSKFLAKVGWIKGIADRINQRKDDKIAGAREAYRTSMKAVQKEIYDQMVAEYGDNDETLKAIHQKLRVEMVGNDKMLEQSIMLEREVLSGKGQGLDRKFVDWWVRQQGWKGNLMKALVVGGAGIGAGIGAGMLVGFAGVPLIGTVVGGAVGGGMAYGLINGGQAVPSVSPRTPSR